MKISNEKPACWDRLEKQFGVNWDSGMIVTYGGVIHCKNPIAPDYMAHELVHVRQQEGIDPDEYLERYISDVQFRKESESAAFRVQAVFLEGTLKDPDELFCRKHELAKQMVRNYGEIFTYEEAKNIVAL